MVRVNIVSDTDGWVLQQISQELHKRLPDSKIYPFGARYREADWTWYCHFSLCLRERVNTKTGALFTHFIPGQEQSWDLASKRLDHCFSMSVPWADHLPRDKTTVAKCGIFDHFVQPVRIMFINKQTSNNAWRKGVDLQTKLKEKFPQIVWVSAKGNLSTEDLCSTIRSVDYVCSTSRVEGGAMPYIEALALGKNLILRDSSKIGYAEECDKYANIDMYSSDAELFEVIQGIQERREGLHKEFNWDNFAEKHLEVFNGVDNG